MVMTREDVLAEATKRINVRRLRAEADLARRLDVIYADHPELQKLDAMIRIEYLRGWSRVLAREDLCSPELEAAKTRKKAYLEKSGIPEDYGVKFHTCVDCNDEGIDAEGRTCHCLITLIRQLTPTGWEEQHVPDISFSDCSLSVFSKQQQERAKEVYKSAWRFAKQCGDLKKGERDLYITGPQGTGKTHLVAAIVNQVKARGRTVLYVPAATLIATISESTNIEKIFKPDPERLLLSQYRMRHLKSVQLLAIDDLGVEADSKHYGDFVAILDERFDKGLSTIITSNLSTADVVNQYDARMASRISGYQQLRMIGDDLRISMRKLS